MTEELLGTTLCLVEQALNDRPILPVSTDSRDLEALIPTVFCSGSIFCKLSFALSLENLNKKRLS